jgi:hypothetical protein
MYFSLVRYGNSMGYYRCIMALIRGFGSYAPCPVCLIPGDQLTNLSTNFPLRTKEQMIKYYQDAQDPDLNAVEKEQILKDIGLRNVEVCHGYLIRI